jgi:hypothetical protein
MFIRKKNYEALLDEIDLYKRMYQEYKDRCSIMSEDYEQMVDSLAEAEDAVETLTNEREELIKINAELQSGLEYYKAKLLVRDYENKQ